MKDIFEIKSISQLHSLLGLAKPVHPLITYIDFSKIKIDTIIDNVRLVTSFYNISLKDNVAEPIKYGRQNIDFEEGCLVFSSPHQVIEVSLSNELEHRQFSGWGLMFHPDLIIGTRLADIIEGYSFFDYAIREALHLSDSEHTQITTLLDNIIKEYQNQIDRFGQKIIVENIELLLSYCERFYERQFRTRIKQTSTILQKFETLQKEYFLSNKQVEHGLPKSSYFSDKMGITTPYLSDILKKETNKTLKEHIHLYVIELAKTNLLNSNKTINELAYELGFEYPHYFSRLFKSITGESPSQFRKYFRVN